MPLRSAASTRSCVAAPLWRKEHRPTRSSRCIGRRVTEGPSAGRRWRPSVNGWRRLRSGGMILAKAFGPESPIRIQLLPPFVLTPIGPCCTRPATSHELVGMVAYDKARRTD